MKKLDEWRKQIDSIDEKIILLIAKRMNLSRIIGKFKKDHNISTVDKKRWEQVLSANLKKSETVGLSKKLTKDLLNLIHKHSIDIQKKS